MTHSLCNLEVHVKSVVFDCQSNASSEEPSAQSCQLTEETMIKTAKLYRRASQDDNEELRMCPLHITSCHLFFWVVFREFDLIRGWKSFVVAVRAPSLPFPLSLLPCSMCSPVGSVSKAIPVCINQDWTLLSLFEAEFIAAFSQCLKTRVYDVTSGACRL